MTSKESNNNLKNNSIIYACCGAISGIITKTVVAPLERVKLLYQVQSYYGTSKYISINQSFSKIIAEDGIKGLYYGNLTNIIRILPAYSLKFMFNDTYKTFFLIKGQSIHNMSFTQLLGTGMLAGFSQATITYPLETIRTRISLDKSMGRHNNIYNCISKTISNNGVLSFYQGYTITFLSTPLYVGLQMSLYEVIKKKLTDNSYSNHYSNHILYSNNTLQSMCAGALAGLIAQTTTYWGDTIKKQMQTNGINGKKQYKNLYDCVIKIYIKGGIKAFYPGLVLNSIKCIPEVSLQFTIYDLCKNMIIT